MNSFGRYGVNKIPGKILASPFVVALFTLLAIPLKIGGFISDITPIVFTGFGMVGLLFFLLGLYMFKEALSIRKSFTLTTATVVGNSQSIAGHRVKFRFTHNSEEHVASVVQSGYKRKGSTVQIIFDPEQPSVAYIYGINFFFVAAIPLILGVLFIGITAKNLFG